LLPPETVDRHDVEPVVVGAATGGGLEGDASGERVTEQVPEVEPLLGGAWPGP